MPTRQSSKFMVNAFQGARTCIHKSATSRVIWDKSEKYLKNIITNSMIKTISGEKPPFVVKSDISLLATREHLWQLYWSGVLAIWEFFLPTPLENSPTFSSMIQSWSNSLILYFVCACAFKDMYIPGGSATRWLWLLGLLDNRMALATWPVTQPAGFVHVVSKLLCATS